MAAIVNQPLVSVEDYISRFAEGNEKPKLEYVDGELIARGMGTIKHAQVQSKLPILIWNSYRKQFRAVTELTIRVEPTKFYIPDVSVTEVEKPIEGRYPGPESPVFLCVEVMSPPDRWGWLLHKCEEYHRWGVRYCWVLDPEEQVAWEYFSEDRRPRQVDSGSITAGPIKLALNDVFSD